MTPEEQAISLYEEFRSNGLTHLQSVNCSKITIEKLSQEWINLLGKVHGSRVSWWDRVVKELDSINIDNTKESR